MSSIAYSVLDFAIVSEGTTIQHTLQNTSRLAQSVEVSGYTRYWLTEHHDTAFIGSTVLLILMVCSRKHQKVTSIIKYVKQSHLGMPDSRRLQIQSCYSVCNRLPKG